MFNFITNQQQQIRTIKQLYLHLGWLLCCFWCSPPPPTSRTCSCSYSTVDPVGCCVDIPSKAATIVHNNCCILPHYPPSIPADCCNYFYALHPRLPPPAFRLIVVCCVWFRGPLLALAFRPESIRRLIPSSAHLWAASAVIVTAMAAESPMTTPPPVAEAFVMVLVGFSGDWAAIWRLPAMVGVVEVSISGVKMARKERWVQKKLIVAFNVLVMVL